jgi:phenylalanyl-tRNA synthetase beta chain
MPVVKVRLQSLTKLLPAQPLPEILDKLPYVGLDIEGIDEKEGIVKVEFNPNRPDFASENGILRALKGLYEIETGSPKLEDIKESEYDIEVDKSVTTVRPIIYGLIAKREHPLDEYEISQLISMQEDLHNGVGRKRKKASIGIHDLKYIEFPLNYTTASKDFAFIPLDKQNKFTLDEILNNFDIGKTYSHILEGHDLLPILLDSQKNIISFPPIINGNITKVTSDTRSLLIEVTSLTTKSAQDILSLLAFELKDMGFELYSIKIKNDNESVKSPLLKHSKITVNTDYINKILGLDLSNEELINCIGKSRISGKITNKEMECTIPSYRIDIFNPIDISEEIAIGYGVYRYTASSLPNTYHFGKKNINSKIFNSIRETLIGLGFIEIINTDIISRKAIDNFFLNSGGDNLITINEAQSSEMEVLRNSMYPSIMSTLARNIHEKYPQKLFEIGKTFNIQNLEIKEEWSLGVAIAYNYTDYTQIKSVLESMMKYCFNKKIVTPVYNSNYYINGHSSKILLDKNEIGDMGQIHPQVLENFKLRTLVSIFQINLDKLIKSSNLNEIKYL